jgi:hypothetical protein
MLVTEAGKGIWNIERITPVDMRCLMKALHAYLEKLPASETEEFTLGELADDLEECVVLWKSQVAAERQTVVDAEERLKKKSAAGK